MIFTAFIFVTPPLMNSHFNHFKVFICIEHFLKSIQYANKFEQEQRNGNTAISILLSSYWSEEWSSHCNHVEQRSGIPSITNSIVSLLLITLMIKWYSHNHNVLYHLFIYHSSNPQLHSRDSVQLCPPVSSVRRLCYPDLHLYPRLQCGCHHYLGQGGDKCGQH